MSDRRRIAVVTGTRADFGLLRPVMHAIDAHPDLDLEVIVTGAHLLPPADTRREVETAFVVAAAVPMQAPHRTGRSADAEAVARGIAGFTRRWEQVPPDVVLVLGDRIEAFAAATAAAVGGRRLAHVHGGDRAEGIADEALRHAMTKLAHMHFTATGASTERVIAMGEDPRRTFLVGSPAIDDLHSYPALDDDAFTDLGAPEIVMLLHPTGAPLEVERTRASDLITACCGVGCTLALDPNHDPGREGIVAAIESTPDLPHRDHLDRATFVGLLRRARIIVGNSSAGLIEAAAIPLRCVNVGSRQGGRQRPRHIIDCPTWDASSLRDALTAADETPLPNFRHPYGDGTSGQRIAKILGEIDIDAIPLSKQNTY